VKYTSTKVYSIISLMLMFLLPFMSGIWIFNDRSVANPASEVDRSRHAYSSNPAWALAATATPTVTPPPTNTPVPASNSSFKVYAFIEGPQGPLEVPYVILSGHQSISGVDPATFEIRGTLNDKEFRCPGNFCFLPVTDASVVKFRAYASPDAMSDEIQSVIRVYQGEGGYFVTLESPSQTFRFTDSCATTWGMSGGGIQKWSEFPQYPSKLDTNKELHYLAYRLISYGIVDASDCAGGGLSNGAPNGCGIERARQAMTAWQNQFNYNIWLTGKDFGIPPKLLKVLIEIESQFWPSNGRAYVDEIGLGQVNQLGMDVALRQDPALYQQVCSTVLSNCSVPYAYLPPDVQAMIRGALLDSFNADCPNCQYGLDATVADRSIPLIALVLRSNCSQVKALLNAYGTVTNYEDSWKFTLVSYHSGFGCLQSAINAAYTQVGVVNWENVSSRLACYGARDYIDRFWNSLVTFDNSVIQQRSLSSAQIVSPFVPTPTPSPLPAPVLSDAKLTIAAIQDKNANGILEDTDWLVGIPVEIILSTGEKLTATTVKGPLFINMSKYAAGTIVTVNMPTLFRSSTLVLPERGMAPVIFIFTQPVLPTSAP
jgi:hypothetical protein